ncbi:hypothetical protein H4R19_002969 [Coemansia spiralis]|nr:hypothetical protein H4R19_002969 [Coemansia spiralis]
MSSQRPSILSLQSTLPRLPVPPLEKTVAQLIESLTPFADGRPEALAAATAKAARFLQVAGRLQQRLISYEKTQPNSWLEAWWLELAYLSWREGLCINSNYWIVLADDPRAYGLATAPAPLLPADPGYSAGRVCDSGAYGEFQIRRAVKYIQRTVDYKELVDDGGIPIDKTKAGPLCMSQYTRYFGMTRIPRPGCDELRQDKATTGARTVIVIVQDQIHSLSVYDSAGHRRLDGDLEADLQAIIADVGERSAHGDLDPAVTVLTAGHRDRWAAAYEKLERQPGSSATLTAIQESLFAVSLDTTFSDPPHSINAHQQTVKCHGTNPGHNRWYDKCITYVVDRNGTVGCLGEHSPCDALIPALMLEHVSKAVGEEEIRSAEPSMFTPGYQPHVRRLRFADADSAVVALIAEAEAEVAHAARISSSRQIKFEDYGATWIKRVAAVSPDAFAQLAIQLTYYRVHGVLAPAYETVSTRQFLHGRTENARPLTREMAQFIRTMCDPACTAADRYSALTGAAAKHQAMLRNASAGGGVDRHMLGLRVAYRRLPPLPSEGPMSDDDRRAIDEFFDDPLLARSNTFHMSTSGLFASTYLVHTGFGCVVPEQAYGINYIIGNDWIKFGIEGKTGDVGKGTDLDRFETTLRHTMSELRVLCEQSNDGNPQRRSPRL